MKTHKIKCDVVDIEWGDIDDESVNCDIETALPNKIVGLTFEHSLDDITDEEIADIVSDKISDDYGFCHFGFLLENIERLN